MELLASLLLLTVTLKGYSGQSSYVLQSESLPEDLRLVPAVGNGHIATQVYHDTIYMNGVYNGRYNTSHRARIPSVHAVNVSATGLSNNRYRLDMYNGVFVRTFNLPAAQVTQTIYAHRTKTRLLINQITIRRKSGQTGNVTLTLTPNEGATSEDINMQPDVNNDTFSYRTGKIIETETDSSNKVQVHLFWTPVPDNVTLYDGIVNSTWTYVTSVSVNEEDARTAFNDGVNSGDLYQSHIQAWRNIWNSGSISVTGNGTLARILNAALFHILISLPQQAGTNNQFYGLSPGGLARGGWINKNKAGGPYNDYAGHVFWDMDTWIMPPMMLLHPDLGKIMLSSRTRVLEAIKDRARQSSCPLGPCQGARYPWEQAFTGYETCPWDAASLYQIHVTADVSYAIRQYTYATNDITFLKTGRGKELAIDIARFWRSRAQKEGNEYEIHGVMGPDEYHFNINNSVFTNYNAKLSLTLPTYLKDLIDSDFTREEKNELQTFQQVAEKLKIPFDEGRQFHPQFDGFLDELNVKRENFSIKQSDVVLLGYPLMKEMSPEVRRNDLEFYEKVTDTTGPDTGTWSMHTVGWLELNNETKANQMFKLMFRNINGPFLIFSEKPASARDGMRATNFITGAGGLLQSVFFGYAGMRLRMHRLDLDPKVLPGTTGWMLNNVNYRGSAFDLQITSTHFKITLRSKPASPDDELYLITSSDRQERHLVVDDGLNFRRQMVTLVTKKERNMVPTATSQITSPTSGSGAEITSRLSIVMIVATWFSLYL